MFLPPQRMTQSQLQKRNQIQNNQSNAKTYRSLLSLYFDNLNIYTKLNKDCIFNLDPPSKIKINKEEQINTQSNLQNCYNKIGWKLSRDSIQRNNFIKKSYEEYLNVYQEKYNCKAEIINLTNKTDNIKLQNQKINKQQLTNTETFSKLKRPVSSKQSKTSNSYQFQQIFNQFNVNFSNLYKMKTITPSIDVNPEHNQKSSIITSNRSFVRDERIKARCLFFQTNKKSSITKRYEKQQNNQIVFQSNQIMIFQKSKSISSSQKHQNKKYININNPLQKSINQIQKMQLQNRIMMTNSVFGLNTLQSHGYKPKSKRWQNFFN